MKLKKELFLLIILFVSPLLGIPILNDAMPMNNDITFALDEFDMKPESSPNIELNTMFFSSTWSNDNGIFYACRKGTHSVAYFGISSVYYVADDTVFTLEFVGSNQVEPVGEQPAGSVTNYLIGSNPSSWKTDQLDYELLRYGNLYPGIDLIYKIYQSQLKYEFVVSPGADPSNICLRYADAEEISVIHNQVDIYKSGNQIADTNLFVFQDKESGLHEIQCSFESSKDNEVTFAIGEYDISQELVIDPVYLAYSTYLGGDDWDYSYCITVENGYMYVGGSTQSLNFPTLNAMNDTFNGGSEDAFLTKFAPDGQTLIYSTYIGGSSSDYILDIDVVDGVAYIAGSTSSSNFPVVSAYDTVLGGPSDLFVAKLTADGQSLIYSTFLGGSSGESLGGLDVEDGYAFVGGYTLSDDYPTSNGFDLTWNGGSSDMFITKLATNGQTLVYSSYLGGSDQDRCWGMSVDNGYAYLSGQTKSTDFQTQSPIDGTHNGNWDAVIAKVATDGLSLVYSTYFGHSGDDFGYEVDTENGYAYFCGHTYSSGFPVGDGYDNIFDGATDGFVMKLSPDGQTVLYSSFIGGSSSEEVDAIAVENGQAYVFGSTWSDDFPIVDSSMDGTGWFVSMFESDGQSLGFSSIIESPDGWNQDIALDNGHIYVTGRVNNPGFPMVNSYNATMGSSRSGIVAVLSYDSDMDTLSDWEEDYLYETDKFSVDSDNDNFLDAYEISYGSNATDSTEYPAIPQDWYDDIYEDLDGNATLIQNLITWADGNTTLLQSVMTQLDSNTDLLQDVVGWLDGNHTTIETLFTYFEANATLLMMTVDAVEGNEERLDLISAIASQNSVALSMMTLTMVGDINEIRDILDELGIEVGDTDYDGLDDLDEITHGTDILCIDTDLDNLIDSVEVKLGTDPLNDDSDADSYLDGLEVHAGTDPLNALSYPGSFMIVGSQSFIVVAAAAIGGVLIVGVLVFKRKSLFKRYRTTK